MWWLSLVYAVEPGPLAGRWEFTGGDAEKAKIAAAVEDGAQRFNFAIRPVARNRLWKVVRLDTGITITGDPAKIELVFVGENPRTSGGPSDGTKVHLHGNDVTYLVREGGTLVVTGWADDGGKETTYTASGDSLKVSHKVWSEMLGDPPLTWTLTYRRAP